MAGNIISLNTSVSVGTDETCTLNVTNLQSLISGSDAYFGDSSNWSLVQIEYRSTTGKQREIVTINPTVGTGIFKVSAKARQEQWVIHEIRVKDFDGDFYTVKKADMQVTDYDECTISPPSPNIYPYTQDFSSAKEPFESHSFAATLSGGQLSWSSPSFAFTGPDDSLANHYGIIMNGSFASDMVNTGGYTDNYDSNNDLVFSFDIVSYTDPVVSGTPTLNELRFRIAFITNAGTFEEKWSNQSVVIDSTGTKTITISSTELSNLGANYSNRAAFYLGYSHILTDSGGITSQGSVTIDNLTITNN